MGSGNKTQVGAPEGHDSEGARGASMAQTSKHSSWRASQTYGYEGGQQAAQTGSHRIASPSDSGEPAPGILASYPDGAMTVMARRDTSCNGAEVNASRY